MRAPIVERTATYTRIYLRRLMLQWNTADRRAVAPDGWDRFLMWIAMWACVGLVAAIAALLLP